MVDKKTFINQLHKEKADDSDNSQALGRLLELMIETDFGNYNHFVLELLQNADDSIESEEKDIEVTFRLIDDFLIFSHTGKHFTENDVKGICNVASGDSGKDKDMEKIGYKGIGFKSIFSISQRVYIISNGFRFKFDKQYPEWNNVLDMPWQIIPIWFEEKELLAAGLDIEKYIECDKVITIINIKDYAKIKEGISQVFNDVQVILFLRHVRSMTFLENDTLVTSIKREDNDNIKTIKVNDGKKSEWLYKEFCIDIPNEIRDSLIQLSDKQCPAKLKNAKKTKLTFAAKLENKEVKALSNAYLYCYLPTEVRYGFNYVINAEFITNAARTDIIDNKWNAFIFRHIGILGLKWIEELVRNKQARYSFTNLIKTKYENCEMTDIKKEYNNGLQEGIDNISFIPKENDEETLLKINEAIVDSTNFLIRIDNSILESKYKGKVAVADYSIIHKELLIKLGAKSVKFKDIIDLFNNPLFMECYNRNIGFNIEIMKFLFNNHNNLTSSILSKLRFLLSNDFTWETPQVIYFPFEQEQNDISNIINIKCLNDEVFKQIKHEESLLNWLNNIGVKTPQGVELFRKSIIPLIDRNEINSDNALPIGRFIFKIFIDGKLSDDDYRVLSQLNILTTSGELKRPSKCYLPNCYKPKLMLQDILPSAAYVSELYAKNKKEISEYKRLFIRIGVKESVCFYREDQIERTELIKKYPITMEYFQYIDSKGIYYTSDTGWYKNSGQHGVKKFLFVDFLEYTYDFNFSLMLWSNLLNEKWKDINTYCNNSTYYTRYTDRPVISFLKYYVVTHKSLPSNQGTCLKSGDLYSNRFLKIINNDFPIVNEKLKIDEEQEEALGIKSKISIKDCCTLLDNISKFCDGENVLKRIEGIYEQIVSSDEECIVDENINLLATDNIFRSANTLYCFNVEGMLPPSNSSNFLRVSDDFIDKEKLCHKLKVTVLDKRDIQLETDGAERDENLKNMLLGKLKYFVTLIANTKSESPQSIAEKMVKKILDTSFYISQHMYLFYDDVNKNRIYEKKINAWYDNRMKIVYYVDSIKDPVTIYSLVSCLEELFAIDMMSNEIHLLLQLPANKAEEWLIASGYEIVDIDEIFGKSIQVDEAALTYQESDEFDNQADSKIGTSEFVIRENEYIDDNSSDVNKDKDVESQPLDYRSSPNFSQVNKDQKGNKEYDTKCDFFNDDYQKKKTNKMISYVFNKESQINDKSNKLSKEESLKAKEIVCEYENKNGRVAEIIEETNGKFDVVSCDKNNEENKRYIIVFGFLNEWNNYSMPLLSTQQFEFAKQKGKSFWIYVVEYLSEDKNEKICRIQNPCELINLYAFDYGWKNIVEQENTIDKYVEGAVICHDRFGVGTIQHVEQVGEIKRLTIKFGEENKRLILNMTEMKIEEGK